MYQSESPMRATSPEGTCKVTRRADAHGETPEPGRDIRIRSANTWVTPCTIRQPFFLFAQGTLESARDSSYRNNLPKAKP